MMKDSFKMPDLHDVASRNPGVSVDRARELQRVVKTLQASGILQKPKYGVQHPFGSIKALTHQACSPKNNGQTA